MAVIAIDPGHGGLDPGAVGFGLFEKDVVLKVGKLLESELTQRKHETVMTRDRDLDLELQPRCNLANDKWADLFVSLHCNGHSNPTARGFETYYFPGSQMGGLLASSIHTAVVQTCEISADRGIKTANFLVLRNTSMPAVLVELAFITNEQDAARLTSERWQANAAKAIAAGIDSYLRGT